MPPFLLINFVLFQSAWFSAALLRDHSLWVMSALLLLHAVLSPNKPADLMVVLLVLPIGMATELMMIVSGVVVYHSGLLLPAWMVLLWCHLAVSFNHSLQWLQKLPVWWQSLLAAVSGSASYFAAMNLGALSLPNGPVVSLLVIALVWAVQLPLMLRLAYHVRRGRLVCPAYK